MTATNDPGKKRVNTRGRKPPEVVRPQVKPAPAGPPQRAHQHGPSHGAVFVGGARNEHGTRVARRVACGRCGSEDHVPYVPKDQSRALCRNCAAEVLKAFEVGTKAPTEMRDEKCNLCGVPFQIPAFVKDDGDPLCPSCLRGFTTWSGSIDTPWEERQNRVLETRSSTSSVVVRKKVTPPKP
jgi:hypothetical protein